MMYLLEQLLLEPMFEVPGSDITHVVVEEDTARGYHPARYEYKDRPDTISSGQRTTPADQTDIVEHSGSASIQTD